MAFPLTAASKNLLSFESRHSVIISEMKICSASSLSLVKNYSRTSSEIYLSNLVRVNTSCNSCDVSFDNKIIPVFLAGLKARSGKDDLIKILLTRLLVSINNNS